MDVGLAVGSVSFISKHEKIHTLINRGGGVEGEARERERGGGGGPFPLLLKIRLFLRSERETACVCGCALCVFGRVTNYSKI